MEESSRKQSAVSQRIYLLDAQHTQNGWDFTVRGSSGKDYRVLLLSKGVECSCPDFKWRKRICKHLYFIVGRIAGDNPTLNLLGSDPNINIFDINPNLHKLLLDRISRKNIYDEECNPKQSRNVDCIICFEPLDTNEEDVCCKVCNYTYHNECINKWFESSTNKSCPHCRSIFENDENPMLYFNKIKI